MDDGGGDGGGGGDPYADYIQINTSDDLAKIGQDASYPLNEKYTIAANITLPGWTPIGSETAPFTGTLYGNNKTITLNGFDDGATAAKFLGLFAYVDGATISDLTVALGTISIDSAADSTIYVGTVAGYAKDVNLSNINVSAGSLTFSANAVVNAGGIIGCGIDSEITSSSVSSAIVITANGNSGVGGIAGSIKSSTIAKAKVRNSFSTGTVTLTWQSGGDSDYGMVYTGGIAGDSAYSEYGEGKIQYYGGLFENCYSTGAISCASVAYPYAGGIVGYLYASSQIKACYTTGAITATATSGTGYTGGIAGNNSSASTIENSYATGNVTLAGPGYIGGIAGQNGSNGSVIQYCYATGTIASNTATANIGGIAGQNYNAENNDVKANAALNAKIDVAASTTYAHRVVGMHGSIPYGETELENDLAKITNNIANVADTTNIAIGEKSANSVDGADSVDTPPTWSEYSTLGWSDTVWKTTLGANGYPMLAWQ
jgi:hypothetical protein